jgi:anti-sigma B factor antagonist
MSEGGRSPLRASISRADGAVVVALAGELDLATAAGLRRRLADVVRVDPPPAKVVLDLAQLGFVDASGISVLLSAQRALAARGGTMVLRSPSRLVKRVVKVLELDHALPTER